MPLRCLLQSAACMISMVAREVKAKYNKFQTRKHIPEFSICRLLGSALQPLVEAPALCVLGKRHPMLCR